MCVMVYDHGPDRAGFARSGVSIHLENNFCSPDRAKLARSGARAKLISEVWIARSGASLVKSFVRLFARPGRFGPIERVKMVTVLRLN